jgi:murein L,D-transpeptidase YcbB/YkuD
MKGVQQMEKVFKPLALVATLALLGSASWTVAAGEQAATEPASQPPATTDTDRYNTPGTMPDRGSDTYSTPSTPSNETDRQDARGSQMAETAQSGTDLSRDDVREVQESLKDKGYELAVDGAWGPNTEQALKEFQSKNGLTATGKLDERTLSMLDVDVSQENRDY